jgi:hypothetical protein
VLSLLVVCTGPIWWLGAAPALADVPPSNSLPPTISGIAQQGRVLTADPGTWSGDDPISFTYQWSDGQTGSTVTLAADDVGQSLTVTVSASNPFGQDSATSDSVGPVLPAPPENSDPPQITGSAQQGDSLSVSKGTWSNVPTGFAYTWADCDSLGNNCAPITGATSSSYTLQPSDVGSIIVASVIASNAGGQSSASSAGAGPVLPAAPVVSVDPVITGSPLQGATLSVSNGTWNNNPTAFTYAWEDCDGSGHNCAPITGASSSSYTMQASDVGSTIVAAVTGSNADGQATQSSASVGPVLPTAPQSVGGPVIAGTAQQGGTLSVSNGTWNNNPTGFSYAWEDCDGSGANCAAISGATASSYKLQASDVGGTVAAVVTASNAGGQTSATSTPVGPVLPSAPAGTQQPTISGTAQQGATLTASNGTWSNNPTSFGYQWKDCDGSGAICVAISGATSSAYALQASDVGRTVVAAVTAFNAGGQATQSSASVGPVLPAAPQSVGGPVIAGTAQQTNTVSVSNGTWSNNPTGFSYAWEDCGGSGTNCTTISGATSSSYKLQASDVGGTVVAIVTAANAGGRTAAPSVPVGPVLPSPPANTKQPAISGTAQQGATLTVGNGTWSNNPTEFRYQWKACSTSAATSCSTNISGATSSTYTPQASDVGNWLSATVTAANAGGSSSAATGTVGRILPAAPVDTTAPGISGTAQQGDTLTVTNGAWINNPTAYSYVWQDCSGSGTGCVTISGAAATTYTLQASDVGKYVSVTVTASNTGGHTSVNTASVGPVLPPPPANTELPAITGTAEQGDVLSVSSGSWSNNPTVFAYQWQECDGSGANCAAISGATSSSYALSAADVGRRIVCVVTASGLGGSASAATAKTAAVVASPTPVSSQPTTTNLLATPAAPVTNQGVTLIATVTAGTTSTALWGTVTFDDDGAAIGGCGNLRVAASGQSATVACSTSFAASTAHLSAVFTPTTGSVLKASVSATEGFTVAPDSSSTSLDAPFSSVTVGGSSTYTAVVAAPAARPGPIQPTGSVEFLDSGIPIGTCANEPLANGQATCTVDYPAAGDHWITALYGGDANFRASSSPAAPVSAVPGALSASVPVLGSVTSTMQWVFHYTPRYTVVRHLVVNAVSPGATVVVSCSGRGCPFANRSTLLAAGKKCSAKSAKPCFAAGSFDLTPVFIGRRLAVGARVAVSIMRPNWVGKAYTFTVRARRVPRIQIGCLAPDGTSPAAGC